MANLDITPMFCLAFDGEPAWTVPSKLIVTVQGADYLKLETTNAGLVRFILNVRVVNGIKEKRLRSLAQCNGYKELKELRNAHQAQTFGASSGGTALLADEEPANDSDEHSCCDDTSPSKTRGTLLHRHERNNIRESKEVMDVAVGDEVVKMLRPGHPEENLTVLIDAKSLEIVAGMCRSNGFSEPRQYEKNTAVRMGGNRRARIRMSPQTKKRRFNYRNADECSANGEDRHSDASDIAEEGQPEHECCENSGDSGVAPEGHTDS